jgi:hypothetical protein
MRVQKGSAIHHVFILFKMWCCIDIVLGGNCSIRELRTSSCFSKLELFISVTPLRGIFSNPECDQ